MLKTSDLALSKNKTCYQGGKGGERGLLTILSKILQSIISKLNSFYQIVLQAEVFLPKTYLK